jgi:hypothetical protein
MVPDPVFRFPPCKLNSPLANRLKRGGKLYCVVGGMKWHSGFKLGALAALSCVFHQAKLRPLPKVFFPDNATVSECMKCAEYYTTLTIPVKTWIASQKRVVARTSIASNKIVF